MKKYNLNETRSCLKRYGVFITEFENDNPEVDNILIHSSSGFWITIISYGDGTYGFIDDVLDTPRYFDTEDKMLRSLLNCPLWTFCA